jgi:ubiquinone/menaquinone biosynthesis C-methylase UbiE
MGIPDWFVDELAHAGGEHLDSGYVPGYDHKASTDPTEDVAALRSLGLDETRTLIDLGAGTGTLALAAARYCRRVIAVDVSPVMLAALEQKAAAAGITNITLVQSGYLSYAHQGEAADFVYSRNALHHLPDFWKAIALRQVARMLKPGGVLFLRDLMFAFEPGETEPRIEAWLARAQPTPDYGWTRAELETHLRDEYSTFTWLLEPMIEHAGFKIRRAEHDPTGIYALYVCEKP